MKTKSSLALAVIVALAAVFSAGCSTTGQSAATTARIQEKSDSFAKLSPDQQKNIQEGWIERGYTPDMVYMVMGKPAAVSAKDANGRKLEMWTYVEFNRPGAGALDSRNGPNNPHYTTQTVAPISGEIHEFLGAAPSQVKPANYSATSATMGQLNVADLNRARVYLFFANGRVAEIKLESES